MTEKLVLNLFSLTDEKLEKWTVNTDEHMNAHRVPFIKDPHIIFIALCSPGFSAPIGRVFANSRQSLETEESGNLLIIFTKIKLEYDYLKIQPELLRKISSWYKYEFKFKSIFFSYFH